MTASFQVPSTRWMTIVGSHVWANLVPSGPSERIVTRPLARATSPAWRTTTRSISISVRAAISWARTPAMSSRP